MRRLIDEETGKRGQQTTEKTCFPNELIVTASGAKQSDSYKIKENQIGASRLLSSHDLLRWVSPKLGRSSLGVQRVCRKLPLRAWRAKREKAFFGDLIPAALYAEVRRLFERATKGSVMQADRQIQRSPIVLETRCGE